MTKTHAQDMRPIRYVAQKRSSAASDAASNNTATTTAESRMRGSIETTKLPSAMHDTNAATTMANVKCEAPKANPPKRFSTVCMHIMANPHRNAATAKGRNACVTLLPAAGATPAGAVAFVVAGNARLVPACCVRAPRPAHRKHAPAARFTPAMANNVPRKPNAGTNTNAATIAPANAPAVLNA